MSPFKQNYESHLMGVDAELEEGKACAQGLAWNPGFLPITSQSTEACSTDEETAAQRLVSTSLHSPGLQPFLSELPRPLGRCPGPSSTTGATELLLCWAPVSLFVKWV